MNHRVHKEKEERRNLTPKVVPEGNVGLEYPQGFCKLRYTEEGRRNGKETFPKVQISSSNGSNI
jgi:hypothetical protein